MGISESAHLGATAHRDRTRSPFGWQPAGRRNGRTVLAIRIPPSTDRPHFSGPSFVRVGSESVRASEKQFDEMVWSRNSITAAILKLRGDVVTLIGLGHRLGESSARITFVKKRIPGKQSCSQSRLTFFCNESVLLTPRIEPSSATPRNNTPSSPSDTELAKATTVFRISLLFALPGFRSIKESSWFASRLRSARLGLALRRLREGAAPFAGRAALREDQDSRCAHGS